MNAVLAVSLAGLLATTATSIAGLYFTSRARTQRYREMLYAEQLKTISDLLASVAVARTAAALFLESKGDGRSKAWEAYRQTLAPLSTLITRSAAILPSTVFSALGEFFTTTTSLLEKGSNAAGSDLDVLDQSSGRFFNVARHSLGVDPLSKESLALFPRQEG